MTSEFAMKAPTTILVLAATLAVAAPAHAQSVMALLDGNTLATVDVATLRVRGTTAVTGLGSPLLGIDVRPADGELYGLAADGTVVIIDTASGAATVVATLDTPLGAVTTVDFNPVADRLRVVGSDGSNLRVDVDGGKVTTDGRLAFAAGDANAGKRPNVVAGAYTNSVKGAKETALYDIDATLAALLRQAPPNDGVLGTIGPLGIAAGTFAFDIRTTAEGANEGWLMAGDTLLRVDLATGTATAAGKVAGAAAAVRDIAALPDGDDTPAN